MQEELQQIIDCLDTSIPETIRILAAPGIPRNPLNLSSAVRSLSEERLSDFWKGPCLGAGSLLSLQN